MNPYDIGSEIKYLNRKVKEQENEIKHLMETISTLDRALNVADSINDKYRDFFRLQPELANWMRDFNTQFQSFKASPYYVEPAEDIGEQIKTFNRNVKKKLSTIANQKKK